MFLPFQEYPIARLESLLTILKVVAIPENRYFLRIVTMKTHRVLWSIAVATIASLSVALPSFARPATLIAQNSNSRINVRSTPSTNASSPHYGLAGDRVEVTRLQLGKDRYMWNYVKFTSGAKGWVRGDFVRYTEGMAKYVVLGGKPGDRINVRSAPSTSASSPHFGVEGDVVQLLTQKTGSDGYLWRYVKFPSGAQGWIRSDLIRAMEEGGC